MSVIYSNLRALDTSFLNHPIWHETLYWLSRLPKDTPIDTYPLRGTDMFAKVMEYSTLPREQCTFESHQQFIDIHYTIRGGEVIELRNSEELEPSGPFDKENDLQFYMPVTAITRVHLLPGYFGIFHPTDAHMPKIADGENSSVFKVVIKVNVSLFL